MADASLLVHPHLMDLQMEGKYVTNDNVCKAKSWNGTERPETSSPSQASLPILTHDQLCLSHSSRSCELPISVPIASKLVVVNSPPVEFSAARRHQNFYHPDMLDSRIEPSSPSLAATRPNSCKDSPPTM